MCDVFIVIIYFSTITWYWFCWKSNRWLTGSIFCMELWDKNSTQRDLRINSNLFFGYGTNESTIYGNSVLFLASDQRLVEAVWLGTQIHIEFDKSLWFNHIISNKIINLCIRKERERVGLQSFIWCDSFGGSSSVCEHLHVRNVCALRMKVNMHNILSLFWLVIIFSCGL